MTGRHLLVTAHPDDDTISASFLLSMADGLTVLQLTDGVSIDVPDRAAQTVARRREREAAFVAAGWSWPVLECDVAGREAHRHLPTLLDAVADALVGVEAIWTHPYEGGHLDHDTAAWLVQTACAGLTAVGQRPPNRMEFASYHATATGYAFGTFWPDTRDWGHGLSGVVWARKQAAIACYTSQAHILRKFPTRDREVYRAAPTYDFSKPAPPPRSRWDVKGYAPSTADWRAAVAQMGLATPLPLDPRERVLNAAEQQQIRERA